METLFIPSKHPYQFGDCVEQTDNPHGYRLKRNVAVCLHSRAYDGLHGNGYRVSEGWMYADKGVWWNGSSVVKDLQSCLLASLVHDLLCDAINHSHLSRWRRWRLRRAADGLYAAICHWQGMWSGRAYIRYIGLRLFGMPYKAVSSLWQRDTQHDTKGNEGDGRT